MDSELLIELVRQRPVLYNLTHGRYMDSNYKLRVWDEIGKLMNEDAATCKMRWNNMRDNYRKSVMKKGIRYNRKNKTTKQYKYSEQMSFLKEFFEDRSKNKEKTKRQDYDNENESNEYQDKQSETSGSDFGDNCETSNIKMEMENIQNVDESENINIPPYELIDSNDIFDPIDDTDIADPSTLQDDTVRNRNRKNLLNWGAQKRALKKQMNQEGALTTLVKYLINKNEEMSATLTPPDPVDAFLAGIAPTLKCLDENNLHLAKSEIFAVVQKYEIKMGSGSTSEEI